MFMCVHMCTYSCGGQSCIFLLFSPHLSPTPSPSWNGLRVTLTLFNAASGLHSTGIRGRHYYKFLSCSLGICASCPHACAVSTLLIEHLPNYRFTFFFHTRYRILVSKMFQTWLLHQIFSEIFWTMCTNTLCFFKERGGKCILTAAQDCCGVS